MIKRELIQIVQGSTVCRCEWAILVVTHAGQHPGTCAWAGRSAWNINGAYSCRTFIYCGASATVCPVHIICVTETNAMSKFMRHNSGYVINIGRPLYWCCTNRYSFAPGCKEHRWTWENLPTPVCCSPGSMHSR